jgi:hypothetical protein
LKHKSLQTKSPHVLTHLPLPSGSSSTRRLRMPAILQGITSGAGYNRRSPPALDSSGDPVVDDCHMPEPRLSNPRKRQRLEQHPLQPDGTSQPLLKRQKRSHPTSGYQPPAAFWDNLSKIWLTKRALREFDRRNSQLAPSPPRSLYRRPHGPVTRRTLKDIKRIASDGGPDLSDLRGVCVSRIPAGAKADHI